MPIVKHGKGNKHVHEDAHNNNGVVANYVNIREHQNQHIEQVGGRFQQCCVPLGCTDDPIDPTDPYDAVKVICNNEGCTYGNWMHKDCFKEWEQSVLSFLRSCGRARSWSEKQRLQNLWTKKGYDLAYKACDCKCGRGHIRKDLDYITPPLNDNHKKARRNKKKNDKPMPVVSTNHKSGLNSNGGVHNNHTTTVDNQLQHALYPLVDNAVNKKKDTRPISNNTKRRGSDNNVNISSCVSTTTSNGSIGDKSRSRTNSISQKNDMEVLDNRPPSTTNGLKLKTNMVTQPQTPSPVAVTYRLPNNSTPTERMRTNSMSSTGSMCSQTSSNGSIPSSADSTSPLSSSPSFNVFFAPKSSNKQSVDHSSTEEEDSQPKFQLQQVRQPKSTMFHRRQDLSAFNALPKTKQNPYNIHMEETAQAEDEDTRNFVLSSLSTKRMNGLRCVLCKMQLPVFDKFPLVDGTLFLSPQAYDPAVVQVIWEGRIQFLNAVCLGCLHGASGANCSSCHSPWDGRSLVVGTMYTYDVFAATPCCQERLTCKHCLRAVVDVNHGLPYYSQYSRMILCPFCKANDYHFIRSLQATFNLLDALSISEPTSICESS